MPVQAVRFLGKLTVRHGSSKAIIGFCFGCHTHNFIPSSEFVTMAVLSVSAPVPAVVGIQIKGGKDDNFLMGDFSYSKSHKFSLLLAIKLIAFPPSIPEPPPIAIIESCFPSL